MNESTPVFIQCPTCGHTTDPSDICYGCFDVKKNQSEYVTAYHKTLIESSKDELERLRLLIKSTLDMTGEPKPDKDSYVLNESVAAAMGAPLVTPLWLLLDPTHHKKVSDLAKATLYLLEEPLREIRLCSGCYTSWQYEYIKRYNTTSHPPRIRRCEDGEDCDVGKYGTIQCGVVASSTWRGRATSMGMLLCQYTEEPKALGDSPEETIPNDIGFMGRPGECVVCGHINCNDMKCLTGGCPDCKCLICRKTTCTGECENASE
jgi:hypothetical protein